MSAGAFGRLSTRSPVCSADQPRRSPARRPRAGPHHGWPQEKYEPTRALGGRVLVPITLVLDTKIFFTGSTSKMPPTSGYTRPSGLETARPRKRASEHRKIECANRHV